MDRYNAEHYLDPTAYYALSRVEREERFKVRKTCVFICSPFAGDIVTNRAKAIRYMHFAIACGAVPFAPHLLYPQVLDESDPDDRELGIRMGLIWLSKCSELWVFGRYVSKGMLREISQAKKLEIPIRYFTDYCKEVFE